MNPPSFTSLSTTEDPENFVENFDVMHVVDAESIEIVAYQLNNVARTWFDK